MWNGENDEDRATSNLIGHQLHLLLLDVLDAVVRKRGVVKTKKERREIRLICEQVRTALRFEKLYWLEF